MTPAHAAFKGSRASEWTAERIARLTAREIEQLRDNAQRLNEAAIVELCSQALKAQRRRPGGGRAKSWPRTRPRNLVARTRAFEARGVYLAHANSWGGVRRVDGAIVLALWATAVLSTNGTCRYLLWAPNADGARPWSDTPAGQERLQHCKRALELGGAEGLLVYGEVLEGFLPEDKAQAVHGVDDEVLLAFKVERVEDSYWAVWGKRSAPAGAKPAAGA